MTPIFLAFVHKGKIQLKKAVEFNAYLRTLEGKSIELTIRRWRKSRSYKQNRFLWGIVYALISETTGFTIDEAHSAMRLKFLLDRTKKIPTLKSTASLTTVEMEAYIESIRIWAAQDLNCIIPLPNEVKID